MYHHILVPVENSAIDHVVIKHVSELAKYCNSKLTLILVAHGHVARNLDQLNLAPSREMRQDAEYLSELQRQLTEQGLNVATHLACGEPSDEILAFANQCGCDLIAMATHGHRILADVFLGSVSREVRHETDIPVLLIRTPKKEKIHR